MDKQEQLQFEMLFPILGIDITQTGFNQRSGTSPVAINVRGFDGTMRRRGASRPGLTPWLGVGSVEQVSDFNPIQHLACVTTASFAALPNAVIQAPLFATVDYAETDSPPVRNAPQVILPNDWYAHTAPTLVIVSDMCVPTQDGGGTGMGTATFLFETDGTTVTITGTFQSAGFPGPYFYSGPPQVVVHTISEASFFPPGTGFVAFSWTVVNFGTGYIATFDVVFRTA